MKHREDYRHSTLACLLLAATAAFCAPEPSAPMPLGLTVESLAGSAQGLRPVTGGVPLARGEAPEGTHFVLRDAGGKPVPVQSTVLARWKDGSARWVLLDFQAAPPPGASARFTLAWVDEGAVAKTGSRLLSLWLP